MALCTYGMGSSGSRENANGRRSKRIWWLDHLSSISRTDNFRSWSLQDRQRYSAHGKTTNGVPKGSGTSERSRSARAKKLRSFVSRCIITITVYSNRLVIVLKFCCNSSAKTVWIDEKPNSSHNSSATRDTTAIQLKSSVFWRKNVIAVQCLWKDNFFSLYPQKRKVFTGER